MNDTLGVSGDVVAEVATVVRERAAANGGTYVVSSRRVANLADIPPRYAGSVLRYLADHSDELEVGRWRPDASTSITWEIRLPDGGAST